LHLKKMFSCCCPPDEKKSTPPGSPLAPAPPLPVAETPAPAEEETVPVARPLQPLSSAEPEKPKPVTILDESEAIALLQGQPLNSGIGQGNVRASSATEGGAVKANPLENPLLDAAAFPSGAPSSTSAGTGSGGAVPLAMPPPKSIVEML
jgi:hypothetical protein